MINKQLLTFILTFISLISSAQIKNIGIPSIVNHTRSNYNASTQNWSITQSSTGFMFFANNDGVMEYDGTNWSTFPMPNRSTVRSVMTIGDTIYTGAFDELGYFVPQMNGKLKYHSLNHLIPGDYRGFDEIWNIYAHQGKIYFQSFNYIFILENSSFKIIKPISQFRFLYLVNDNFFVVDAENGLMTLRNDTLQLLSSHPLFLQSEIRCIFKLENEKLLIGTSNEGLFIFDGNTLQPWDTGVNQYLKADNLFSAIQLTDGNFVFGTIRNGIYISNPGGNILQHINRFKGLQNNTVLSLFEDKSRNLWLGLDNGIDYVEVNSPITTLNYNYNIESTYASLVHNGILYVGTNQGLYAIEYSKITGIGTYAEKFELIKGTEGQVWSLALIDNTLLCGHNFGCFQIDGFTARQISDIMGFWSFIKPSPLSDIIIAGTYTGLVRLKYINNRWELLDEIGGFNESCRSIFLDKSNKLWVAHGYRGIYQLQLTETYDQITQAQLFRGRAGLPDELPYNIQTFNNEMVVTTNAGISQFDYTNQIFKGHHELKRIFEGKEFIDKIHQDKNGNLWYFANNSLGVIRLLEDGSYRDITAPFSRVNKSLLPAFENIYVHDANNIFIGTQHGIKHYDPTLIKDYNLVEEVFIREAYYFDNKKGLSFNFWDRISNVNDNQSEKIPYTSNSLTFRFTIPAYESPEDIMFSHRLAGFDDSWSEWDAVNFKEYTNLREGNYAFEVKAMNAFGIESRVKSVSFSVAPPFLRSRTAIVLYSFILLLVIAGNIYYVRRRVLRVRQREKNRHEKRLAQREKIFLEKSASSEQEILQLRNERLKSEMQHKNKELANTTLHLIHKNRTLTAIKNDLNKLVKANSVGKIDSTIVHSIIKKINKDIRNEKSWELFNEYFDEVHQDFTKRIKDKHTHLTPKELRLCAYLRMNISTKEIAPLMNISVRGVEISRYRLRTKMKLDRNTNLTEYILSF